MTPFLSAAQKMPIEQLLIDKTGISIRLFGGTSQETAFVLRSWGYSYFTEDQQEAMRLVLEQELPQLAEREKYNAALKPVRLLNGDREYVFSYTLTAKYKSQLFRASAQYRNPVQTSW